jgi:hypothetical protein
VNDLTTQEILLALGYPRPVNEGTISANYLSFKPIAVKNSIPVTVESPLFFSSFQNPLAIPSSLPSLSNPLSQTQFLAPPQIGNVVSPDAPGPGTYTQVRWLTFNDFFGNSPQLETFDFLAQGPAPGTDAYNQLPLTAIGGGLQIRYVSKEGYSLTGAFTAESFVVPTSIGPFSSNPNDWYKVWVDQFFTLTFYGSITKYFNDPSPSAIKATVPCLTVTFPYLQTNTDVKPYQYQYRFPTLHPTVPCPPECIPSPLNPFPDPDNPDCMGCGQPPITSDDLLPNNTNLYSDSTFVALMNYGTEITFGYGQSPQPFVPRVALDYSLTSCVGFGYGDTGNGFRGFNDCLRNRYLYNPLTSSLLNNEAQPIELKSHRRTGRLNYVNQPNESMEILNWSFNPCMVENLDQNGPSFLVDESLNHPDCTKGYNDIDQGSPPPPPTQLTLSSYECRQDTNSTAQPQPYYGMHRASPLGTVFTCKLFQWFVKNGKGSSMPIVVSYNYNNT